MIKTKRTQGNRIKLNSNIFINSHHADIVKRLFPRNNFGYSLGFDIISLSMIEFMFCCQGKHRHKHEDEFIVVFTLT